MNNEKKRTRAITAETFACVKMLLKGGASHQECAKYMKIGTTTVNRIASAETYEEYKNILAAMNVKYHEKYKAKRIEKNEEPAQEEKQDEKQEPVTQEPPTQIVEHRQSVTVQTTYYVNQKLDKIEEVLKGISAKLACIIDDLYGTNTRKDA